MWEEEDDEKLIRPEAYAHSPAHYAVALGDPARLARVLSALPRLPSPPQQIPFLDAAAAAAEELLADRISSVLDRRDVPRRDTPLHLAARLGRDAAADALCAAGADPSLQNARGWTPHQEAICLRRRRMALQLLRHHRASAVAKLRRRLPSLVAALHRVRDFYIEISVRFECPVLPFLPRAAPSDTFRIWKRGADLRADTSFAGFDGLRVRRADHSFIFLASGAAAGSAAGRSVPRGSLLVLDRAAKRIHDAFADSPGEISGDEAALAVEETAYRPGVDVTAAELVPLHNWRRRERAESVGQWKARVYDVHNVVFSLKTMKPAAAGGAADREFFPLELDEDADGGYLVAELPDLLPPRHSCYERGGKAEARRRSVDLPMREARRRSLDLPSDNKARRMREEAAPPMPPLQARHGKEKETVKSLRPTVWLTEEFPLKTEEFLPLLDILSNKMKAVQRLRELLTTKFPPGTFPVKVAIPVLPAVRVVFTFTKFVDLQPPERFFTPPTSPITSSPCNEDEERDQKEEIRSHRWPKWIGGASASRPSPAPRPNAAAAVRSSQVLDDADQFAIPADYRWVESSPASHRQQQQPPRAPSGSKPGLKAHSIQKHKGLVFERKLTA